MQISSQTLPPLYHKGSKGAIYQWRVWAEDSDVLTEYGQVDGKLQQSRKTCEGTNSGRSNERTPQQQAEFEAQAMFEHKLARKYRRSIQQAETDELILPMLAKDYGKQADKIVWRHVYVQPKLDGLRLLAVCHDDGNVELLSRQGKDYPALVQIKEDLEEIMLPGEVFDGEVYKHGWDFNRIVSAAKKTSLDTAMLEYHVYDVPRLDWMERGDPDDDYQSRGAEYPEDGWFRVTYGLDEIRNTLYLHSQIRVVETQRVFSEESLFDIHKKFVEQGYEGTMVRTGTDTKYKFAYRSGDLLKLKDFKDEEFTVVGFETGRGKMKECPIYICETDCGKQFKATPRGTMEQRRQLLEEASSRTGQFLTVRYFEKSKDNIPRFPIGIGFRPEEDMP